MYIAHKREEDLVEQPLSEHLYETAELAKRFAAEFGYGEYGYLAGILHDLGKYSQEFQNRIRYNTKKCDHSTAGAIVAMNWQFGKLLAYAIAGHHSGLQNSGTKLAKQDGTLYARFAKENELPNYGAYSQEFADILKYELPPVRIPAKGYPNNGFAMSMFVRMIYSCLVDADFLDTERFMRNHQVDRTIQYDFKLMIQQLHAELNKFNKTRGIINELRDQILRDCIQKANFSRGLFSLSVPTGGGKTLSSMAFALHHLKENGLRRIIYVIPYTSIIEQTASKFSEIFGKENILEHHSNYDYKSSDDDFDEKRRLATENWDSPIVVTTNVQFFESLLANKSSQCRKLHNIANSVIIFDEAQMIPTHLLKPCLGLIEELVRSYQCTAVLCTATLPAFSELFTSHVSITELCSNIDQLSAIFRRTEFVYRNRIDTESLAEEINHLHQALVIVNTRNHAKKLFELIRGENVYHLTTLLCPHHRKQVIHQIKEHLERKEPCIVVSTRLIEAGVDIDFPVVYRALSGLDSLIQSAGRCNREGKLANKDGKILGTVYIFEPEGKYMLTRNSPFGREISIMKMIYQETDDISLPSVIYRYFKQLYQFSGEDGVDSKQIVARLNDGFPKRVKQSNQLDEAFNFDFEDIAKEFQLIESSMKGVIIPMEGAIPLLKQLDYVESTKTILRKLQAYTVQIFPNEFAQLFGAGKLKLIYDNIAILLDINDYSVDTGLIVHIESGQGIYF